MSDVLSNVERKTLRNLGRDRYYHAYGTDRDSSMERAAKRARGDEAGRRQLDDWKRQECARRFMALSETQQLELCPEFQAYIDDSHRRDEDESLQGPGLAQDAAAEQAMPEASQQQPPQEPPETRGARSRRALRKRKFGRPVKEWADKSARAKRDAVLKLLQMLVSKTDSIEGMATVLATVVNKACGLFPGLHEALALNGVTRDCKCGQLMDALKSISKDPCMQATEGCRVAVAGAVQRAGFKSQRKAKAMGIDIAQRPWKLAKIGRTSKGSLKKRGRPSLLANPTAQRMVREAAEANSHESSKFMVLKNKDIIAVRHWSASPHQVYLQSPALMKGMSYKSFVRLLAQEVPHVKRGAGVTDYCDHCHAFSTVLVKLLGLRKAKPATFCLVHQLLPKP